VAVLVITGAFASWRQIRSLEAALDTDFGKVLIAKVALVGVLLAFGARNRLVLRRSTETTIETGRSTLQRLGRVVTAEIAVGAAIVVASTLLSQTIPSREVVGRPISGRSVLTSATVDVSLERSRVGRNEMHVLTLDGMGRRVDVGPVEVAATLRSAEIGPLEIVVRRAGPGHFVATPRFDLAGRWEFVVSLTPDEFTSESATVTLEIR
jgi:copper transport protein